MGFIAVIVLVIIVVAISILQKESHITRINNQIEAMGGKVISIEKRSILSGLGPFMVVGKGRTVYKIQYSIRNEEIEGWVRFGGLMGPDWRL